MGLQIGGLGLERIRLGIIYKTLTVIGRRGKARLQVLFDSGATRSLLEASVARRLADPVELPEPETYSLARGTMVVREGAFLQVVLNRRRIPVEARVVEGLSESLILGADFLQIWDIRLRPKKKQVLLDLRALRLKAVSISRDGLR